MVVPTSAAGIVEQYTLKTVIKPQRPSRFDCALGEAYAGEIQPLLLDYWSREFRHRYPPWLTHNACNSEH